MRGHFVGQIENGERKNNSHRNGRPKLEQRSHCVEQEEEVAKDMLIQSSSSNVHYGN